VIELYEDKDFRQIAQMTHMSVTLAPQLNAIKRK